MIDAAELRYDVEVFRLAQEPVPLFRVWHPDKPGCVRYIAGVRALRAAGFVRQGEFWWIDSSGFIADMIRA